MSHDPQGRPATFDEARQQAPNPADRNTILEKRHQSWLGLRTLAVALGLGVIGQVLFDGASLGLNSGLWIGLGCLASVWLMRWNGFAFHGDGRWLLLIATLLAFCVCWRDSPTLRAMNVLAALFSLGLAASSLRQGRISVARITAFIGAPILCAGHTMLSTFNLLLLDIHWRHLPQGRLPDGTVAMLRGLLLATPIVIAFGALFSSADAVFGSLVSRGLQFNYNPDWLFRQLMAVAGLAWLSAGFLRYALQARDPNAWPAQSSMRLGATEMKVVLGLLNALFAAFVLVQVGYLFGGVNQMALTNLSYAEYARRGFFELVWATALVLPLLLILHWSIPRNDADSAARQERAFRWLALALIVQVAVVMASALQRMRLYQLEYGLTELRLYPTAFMAWMAVVLVWFALTVLRGQRARFGFGAFVAGVVCVLTLNAINPDGLIVRVNLGHVQQGKVFDAEYARQLSADAVPALLEGLNGLTSQSITGGTPESLRQHVRDLVGQSSSDWRS